jgi:hypothetical protein
MPLRRSAVGRASRKDEASSLLGWNGEAEDAAPCSTPLTVAPHLHHLPLFLPMVVSRSVGNGVMRRPNLPRRTRSTGDTRGAKGRNLFWSPIQRVNAPYRPMGTI